MAEPFKIGDTVRLKSRGPTMTVTVIGKADDDGTVWISCMWFDDKGNKQDSTFPANALEPL